MVYIHNVILLSYKREWNFAIYNNMDELGGHYAKWNKSEKDQILYDITYMLYLKKYDKLVNITKEKDSQIQRTN